VTGQSALCGTRLGYARHRDANQEPCAACRADAAADQAHRQTLIAWHMELHPAVDWSRDHQLVIATGEIQAAPDAWEAGWLPENDRQFGGTPCVCTTTTHTETWSAAA
jgi:hypothetical protein